MKPTVLGFMGTMSHIVSVLQKTRNGLLIDMRRANALADKKEFDKIEAPNSTVVRFYNTNLSVNHCEELLRTNPPSLHYTTVKHLLEILELVKQLGGMKLSPSHFIRKVVGRVAGRGAAEELACCLPYMVMHHGEDLVVVDSDHYGAMSSLLSDFFNFDNKSIATALISNPTPPNDNAIRKQIATVISEAISNIEEAFIPCLDRLAQHLDKILETTELEPDSGNIRKKTGPIPLFERFPEIIDEANAFLKENSLAAHSRRRLILHIPWEQL